MFNLRVGPLPRLNALLRRHFLSGILVVTPLGVIAWIVLATLGTIWELRKVLPSAWQPSNWISNPLLATLIDAVIVIGFSALLALAISFTGWISKQLMGKKILEFFEHIIQHIPVLRSIYAALEQLLKTMAQSDSRQFSRVIYLEYPRKGVWALAFVTGKAREPSIPENHVNVYVPTTPNPTSGFHLIVPESEIRDSNMSVEEAFRTILSLGIAQSSSHADRSSTASSPASRKTG